MGISPYLRGLRERVGHDLILLPAVAVLPWDAQGRLLMVRESQSGLWQTVGGAVDPDESPYEAAVRETAEETGLSVRIERIRAVVGGPQYRLLYPNGDLVSYVSTVLDARVTGGTLRPDGEETVAAEWMSTKDLREAQLTEFTVALLGDPAVAVVQEPA